MSDTKCINVAGYRIIVNGSPKGEVAGTQTRALLEGLHARTMYRMTVKALSAAGESGHSNMVVFNPDVDATDDAGVKSCQEMDAEAQPSASESATLWTLITCWLQYSYC